MTLDEVIKDIEPVANHDTCWFDEHRCIILASTLTDALYYLRVFRDAKNDHMDDLMMKTAGLQRAIDQHMTAIKELDRVKRMYKRELRAANEIRSKNKE